MQKTKVLECPNNITAMRTAHIVMSSVSVWGMSLLYRSGKDEKPGWRQRIERKKEIPADRSHEAKYKTLIC